MNLSIAFVVAFLLGFASLLNVPITVKETAGVGSDGFPVSFVLPLPFGQHVATNEFRVVDESGVEIPAQFEVVNRYWTSDPQYLRHVLVHFQPTVAAWNGTSTTGNKVYFVQNQPQTATISPRVTVTDSSDDTSIVTGPLKFVLRKTQFTVINELWFDSNGNGQFEDGEKVVAHNPNNGGVLVERDDVSKQYDSDRSDLTWEVEESGPLRAVVRIDYPTLYNGTDVGLLKRGAAVRIYAYAGKPFLYLDYQLQNSANVRLSWYLYFKEMNVEFTLNNMNTNRVKVGQADGTIWEKTGSNPNVRLFQRDLLKGDLLDNSVLVKSSNATGDVWMSLQDTTSNVAVTTTLRHFWERWPNALATQGNKLSIQLFPRGSATWTNVYKQSAPNFAGLYFVDDMTHFHKESFLYFHTADTSSESIATTVKLFHNPPVAVIPTSWFAESKATLDLGGAVPVDAPSIKTPEKRVLNVKPSVTNTNGVSFGDPDGLYRAGTCTTGGWPYSAAQLIASEDPADYFLAQNLIIGELNARPQWLAHFNYELDNPTLRLSENPYCGQSWRRFDGHGLPVLTAPAINGTGRTFGARDDEHGWFWHVEEAYYLTGNLWAKDWMKFVSEFRQVRLNQRDPWPDMSHRALGHSLQHAFSSFRITGKLNLVDLMAQYVTKYLVPILDPYHGDQTPDGDTAGFQTGYLARWNANLVHELFLGASTNPVYAQYLADAFNHLYGMISWNYKWGNFPYYARRNEYPMASSSAGFTMIEPELFTYLMTGHEGLRNHVVQFVTTGIKNGTKPYGEFKNWQGAFENRIYQRIVNYTRVDSQPPAAVTDLLAYRADGTDTVIFRWTQPADAHRYHAVYCNRSIVEEATNDTSVCNWWAGKAVGVPFGKGPFYREGQHQYFYFTTNTTGPVYLALFSFDDNSNMSPISNIVQPSTVEELVLPPPTYSVTPTSPNNAPDSPRTPAVSSASSLSVLVLMATSIILCAL